MDDTMTTARGAMRRRVTRLPAVVALVAALIVPGSSASGNPDWRAKVDPGVLSAAALGATEFVIYLQEQADLAGADDLRTKEAKGRFVYETLTATARGSQGGVVAELDRRGAWHREFWIVNAVHAKGDLAVIQAVAERAEVSNVFPVGSGRLDPPAEIDTPGGPTSTEAVAAVGPSIDRVRADEVWALGYTGQGVTVAGADTGVRWTHNALKRQYRGWDGTAADHNYHWHDAIKNPNTECPAAPPMGASPQPCDDDRFFAGGHGTHTVGTMVGDDGGANQIGMAPGARWIACRNMNNGLGVVPTYLDCMQWFIAPTDLAGQNPDPSKAPHVVNNSWGCVEGCAPPLLQQPLEASRAAGIVYVVSTGNDGPACSTVAFPLSVYEAAFSVGATNIANDNIASFSSRGPVLTDGSLRRKPDISAPGVGVRSALRASDSAYGSASGTSMAGPHVAGLVALMISANPSLAGNVDRIEEIIEQTAVPRPAGGCGTDTATSVPNNIYGWGRINALDAVLLAENRAPVAVDDTATTERDVPVTIDVLANDTDPDGDTLTVTQVEQGQNGATTDNGDGTVTYTPASGFVGADSFGYTVDDGFGNSDTATVFVTVTEPPQATGGGWLDNHGKKINFGFNAERTAGGPTGELQLNDRLADVKIHIEDVTFVGPVEGCGLIPGGENSLEFHGTGRYNGAAAGFRVCVQDNGEGSAAGPDLFYLECASGCDYATTDAGADEAIEGGNIQVAHVEAGSEGGGAEEASEPTTMVLDPLLLSEATAGQGLTLTVSVYDQHQEALAGAAVTVTQVSGSGTTLLQGVTDAAGTATILAVASDSAAEYVATAGTATSNAISVAPLVS